MTWEHTCYLSDGTKLSQHQYAFLVENGWVEVDGRLISQSKDKTIRDALYAFDVFSSFVEIVT